MNTVLVIGATGQLGMAAIRKLASRHVKVRAFVRSSENATRFRNLGIESSIGDLTDPGSLTRACAGVDVIVATANAAIPTRGADSFKAVDSQGYRNLIEAGRAARVRRFVYVSVPLSRHTRLSPFLKFKRQTEQLLLGAGFETVILRADIFMDTAFAMMGSAIPLRGAEASTVLRPFAFANRYFKRIRESIEQKNVALIPGDGSTRHAFVCVDDMAEFLAASVSGPPGTYSTGGPEALTFVDIVKIYERVLGTKLRIRRTPAPVFRVAASVLKPFSPAGANLMCLNYIASTEETFPDNTAASTFHVRLTSAETFLRNKSTRAATA